MAAPLDTQSVGGPAQVRGPAVGTRLRRAAARATPLFLLAPALALLVWLLVLPTVEAVRLAFTDWDGFTDPEWIGLGNFTDLLSDDRFTQALKHNLIIIAVLPIWIAVPYSLAWGLHRKIWGWSFFRFAFFLPVVLSPVVLGVYYGMFLGPDGPLNSLLRATGLGALAREWTNEPGIALPVVIVIAIWWTLGIGVLIFLSALSNLDGELEDAARVDGASRWQIQRHVVFSQMRPVIQFWAIIIVILSFTAFFPLIYTLTDGGPGFATATVDFYLYQEAFGNGNLGYASAVAVALVVIIGAVSGIALALLRGRRKGIR
jgi:ABC-type sugar transport system permease subunit